MEIYETSKIDQQLTTLPSQLAELRPSQFRYILDKAEKAGTFLPEPVFMKCVESLLENFQRRSDQYADRTLTQLYSNWKLFVEWAMENGGHQTLPATPSTVESYIRSNADKYHRNSLRSHLWAIDKMHTICGLHKPSVDEYVTATLKGIVNQKIAAREGTRQAIPFQMHDLYEYEKYTLARKGRQVLTVEMRNLAFLSVAYDTMLREQEMVNIRCGDIEIQEDGSAILQIPFTKTNRRGDMEYTELAPGTVQKLLPIVKSVKGEVKRSDQKHAISGQMAQFLFMPLLKSGLPKPVAVRNNIPLSNITVDTIFQSAFISLGREGRRWSGHSARVGAAVDLTNAKADLLEIQHLGRWRTSSMPYQYGHSRRSVRNSRIRELHEEFNIPTNISG